MKCESLKLPNRGSMERDNWYFDLDGISYDWNGRKRGKETHIANQENVHIDNASESKQDIIAQKRVPAVVQPQESRQRISSIRFTGITAPNPNPNQFKVIHFGTAESNDTDKRGIDSSGGTTTTKVIQFGHNYAEPPT